MCCYNDELALAALAATSRARNEVPGRLAVLGVDVPLTALVHPALLTIRTDFARRVRPRWSCRARPEG